MKETVSRSGAGRIIALGFACLLVANGCDRGPEMYQVTGHVFYKDGTVPRGGVAVLFLQPKQNTSAVVKKSASGAIKPDGSFELWSRKAGDGVHKGEYDVAFNVIKAVMDPKPLIVEKYTRPETSGYEVTVDRDIHDLKFEIEPMPGVVGAPPKPAE